MTNIVHLIDNMEFMEGLPDKAFDLAVVDLQTGQGEDGGKQRRSREVHVQKFWDREREGKEYFNQLFRISKNQIIWQSQFYVNYLPVPKLGKIPGWICWDKKKYNSDYSDFEMAWTSFYRGNKIFIHSNTGGLVWKGMNIQPCQKPIALYKWLLANYAKPGQTIFDSHVGSGSIRIACHDMGFDFIGCELDPDYYQAQDDRFREHIKKGKELFTPEEYQERIYASKSEL